MTEAIRARVGLPSSNGSRPRETQVAVPSGALVLSGTLTLPAGEGPHPAALILPGSGPLDRDGDVRGARLGISRDLARVLAQRGVASLRYDRRGVGASQGDFLAAGLHDNLADARAMWAWLRARTEVRHGATTLIGHSEGALLASAFGGRPEAESLAGVVLLAGAARTGEETLAWQTRRIAPGLPLAGRVLLRLLRIDLVERQARNVGKIRATATDVARIGGRRINARWHRELLDFDPTARLAQLPAPVLAVTGDKDIQVDPADLDVIAATAPGPVKTVRVPDLTHLLRRDPEPPRITAYRRLARRPTDPEILARVADWVAQNAAARA